MESDIVQKVCIAAAANVVGATGVAGRARNCAIARTGAGVYTLTVPADQSMLENELLITLNIHTLALTGSTNFTSATVLTISTVDAAAAATDADFDITVSRLL
jgi:hypothetical protein